MSNSALTTRMIAVLANVMPLPAAERLTILAGAIALVAAEADFDDELISEAIRAATGLAIAQRDARVAQKGSVMS